MQPNCVNYMNQSSMFYTARFSWFWYFLPLEPLNARLHFYSLNPIVIIRYDNFNYLGKYIPTHKDSGKFECL